MRLSEEQELDLQIKRSQSEVLKILGGVLTMVLFYAMAGAIALAIWLLSLIFK
jgi:hypothetical protein